MSRLTDLIAQAKAKSPELGQELEREFDVLSSRRSFGLNFERHRPESVELPGRPVRKGDKVHVLPPRGSTVKGDQRLWKVLEFETTKGKKLAQIVPLNPQGAEQQSVAVEDLVKRSSRGHSSRCPDAGQRPFRYKRWPTAGR